MQLGCKILWNYRMDGVGGTLEISSTPTARGRDTFQCPRLLQALPNVALDTSRAGAATTFPYYALEFRTC